MFFSDVNETPQILCETPFYASPSFSRGSIVGQLQSYDPDNERYHISKRRNPSGPFDKRKQLLIYSFLNENIIWPFHMTLTGIIYWKMVGCDSTLLSQYTDILLNIQPCQVQSIAWHTVAYHRIRQHTISYHTMPCTPYQNIQYYS